ncbi:hypothetical protein KW794_01590 [Candidatus Saccharibacteria bacterium]|nr:hypothetical protein [Candidatus Saccharibacteria bacterium]
MKKDEMETVMKQLKPKRTLKPDFTEQTLRLATGSKQPWLSLPVLRHAPALAIVFIFLLLSGTVYAAINWPEITAKFGSKTELPSGNKIIGVDTTNCNYFQVQNKQAPTNEKIYYEINKDSSLTDEQVVSMIQGICEENTVNAIVGQVIKPYVDNDVKNMMTGNNFHLDSFTKTGITVTNDIKDIGPGSPRQVPYQVTYNIAPDVKVYDGKQSISYSDLKSGDYLTLLVKNDQPQPAKADLTANYNPWLDPDLMTVLAIIRTPELRGSPMTFFAHLGKDFVRTEPCDSNPTGFCRAYDFVDEHPN